MPDPLTNHIILNHERDFIQMLHILKCYIKTQVTIYSDFTLEASIDTRGACHRFPVLDSTRLLQQLL